ncbi:type I secretion system permease/ATPase [Prosthecochloris sp. CIB 2401]|uniref:type I secretion system permease/ATPase n=1 Tax=Prosthecochloris sp. CIB 2401 TaxID=1868325 RepID=UPI00080ABF15|nr:type I secretion system permease/ATPase [Prosthecochloris sp. CIB 2401]ANT64118.1 Type I secretion system ATP-binding protein PrsD [Prosthecochloris sp. CIB 2401]
MNLNELQNTRLGKVLLGFKREFIWVGVFSLVANLLMLTPTIYMLQIYDRVLQSRSELTLLVLTVIVLAFFVIMGFAEWLRSRLLVRIGVRLDEQLNSLVFHAGFSAFLKKAKHNTVQTFTDLTNIRQFLTGTGVIAFFDMPWTPVYLVFMFLLHPVIGWLGILFALIQAASAWWSHFATAGSIEKASDTSVASSSYVQGKLRNIEPVHAMGMSLPLRERWLERHAEAIDASSELHHRQQRQQSINKFIRYTMQSLTLGAGALLVLNGEMTTGGMIAGNVLMSRALAPLDMMVTTWKQFIQARAGFLRLEELLSGFDMPEPIEQTQDIRGDIRAEGLSASAAGGTIPILHGIEAAFRPGELVAMVGPSGSGKSTFARCLVGIWPETKGVVLIDSIPVEEWDRSILGPHIGYLPQDVELFEGTFAENIARFQEVDPDKVIAAATATGIHEMILRFPKGYDTPIGMAGGMLSGGQRQRVALARALYGDPSIIILDEPNANLDEAGERALGTVLRQMADAGKTVLLITHRPAVLALADRIMVMQEGHILHNGTRDEILRILNSKKTAKSGAIHR